MELIEFEEFSACSAAKAIEEFVNSMKLKFGQDFEVEPLLKLKFKKVGEMARTNCHRSFHGEVVFHECIGYAVAMLMLRCCHAFAMRSLLENQTKLECV